MKVWYDACTGKQVRYGAAIGKRLRAQGHEFTFTTRLHPDTVPLAKLLGENPLVVGKYSPTTLASRLEESAKRIIEFSQMFRDQKPDVAIAHQSVELCRAAFGLGIPIIITADTPYAHAVNRLTIPFAHTVVVSKALPKSFAKKYAAQNIIQFNGVDEVAWIKTQTTPKKTTKNKPLIVLRQIETKATYAMNKRDSAKNLAEQLGELGNVHLLERYGSTGDAFGEKVDFEDSASLVANADLVVSYGGTISREAALQGVPSIAASDMAKTNVNTYLVKKGFPFYITTERGVMRYAKELLGKRFDVSEKLATLENPVDVIAKVVETLNR
jgi:predicted glycosyltransferase